MRIRSKLFALLAIAALFASACGSTTVVAREDRPAGAAENDSASVEEAEPDSTEPDATETDTSDATDDPSDEAEDGDDGDDGDDGEAPDAEPTAAPPRALEEDSGFGLGGDAQVAGLVDDCIDGSDLACDVLYQLTEFDSPEEEIALTCGGRSAVTMIFCTEGIEADDTTAFSPDSEALPQLVTDCEVGDMTACDFLYFRSPINSEWEEIGNTCAGRTSVALPDCRTQFGE